MIALILLIFSVTNIVCFIIGARVGQKIVKGEPIELPNINPIKAVREHRERKEAEMKQDRLNTILHNIEKYDGTGKGQEDVG